MPIFKLKKELVFPDPALAEPDGLLAIGGDLSPKRLLLAYMNGIFPWFSKGYPYMWWSPDPRLILFPDQFKVSKSLLQIVRGGKFQVTFDRSFPDVIHHCSVVNRKDQDGTWITPGMKKAYSKLHELGFAHSVETWHDGVLAGGLYGVSIGKAFFGESMFHLEKDASKIALYTLVRKLQSFDFHFIDSQVHTDHLISLGAVEINREKYLEMLKNALAAETLLEGWNQDNQEYLT